MRIIAGEFRGRPIEAPKGRDTRPTTDRVRESLMSMLYSARGTFEAARVLDVFAGSGALGLEALSRGASEVCFLEHDTKAAAIIKHNLETLGVSSSAARVMVTDSYKASLRLQGMTFDIVFLDPPYLHEPNAVLGLVAQLREAGVLESDTLVCYEYDRKNCEKVEQSAQDYGIASVKQKAFGDTVIELFCVYEGE